MVRKSILPFLFFLSLIANIYALASWISPKLSKSTTEPAPSTISEPQEEPPVSQTAEPVPEPVPQEDSSPAPESLALDSSPQYGHLPYAEADPDELVTVASFGLKENQRFEKLHPDAAAALMQMTNAARDEGVWIVLSSAFRNYDNQAELFEAQTQKRGSPEAAAKSSAPAGHSEHHTGYAMDLSDGHMPSADVNQNFATTDAYLWLLQHASEYGFELSFPQNNPQGVSYEPWHWRFVGTPAARETFSRAIAAP